MADNSQSQKAGEGSMMIQAGGNVSIGLSYADVKQIVSEERERIIQHVWDRAQERLTELGLTPGNVPMKTLIPLLQYASMEEEESLQDRWANLLANASDPRHSSRVQPSFPDILRQLSPMDAVFLEAIFEASCQTGTTPGSDSSLAREDGLRDLWLWVKQAQSNLSAAPAAEGFSISLDNLIRLNLVSRKTFTVDGESPFMRPYGTLPAIDHFSITTLGYEFVSACRKPEQR